LEFVIFPPRKRVHLENHALQWFALSLLGQLIQCQVQGLVLILLLRPW